MDRRRGRMDTCTRLLEGAQTAMRPGLLFRRDFLALASMAGVSVVFAPVRRAAAGPPSPNPYAATRPGQFSPAVAGIPERVYVPNTKSNTVDVIDPATFTRVGHFPVGATPPPHHALLGPPAALRHQHLGELPHGDRPAHGDPHGDDRRR